MENASKALLMTASILVGVILLSLGIYLVNSFRNFSQTYSESIETHKMEQFNSQFTAFSTRKNISMHEILTLTNFANEFNFINNLEPDDNQFIKVYVKFSNTNEICLTNPKKFPTKEYRENPDKFFIDLLDGTYINPNSPDEGKYMHDEDNKAKYYNCYECKKYSVNPVTGRIESITFEFKNEVTI